MRGMEVIDTGAPHECSKSVERLSDNFQCSWRTVDNLGPVDTRTTSPIHRSATLYCLDTKLSIFETGIKVVDLLAPYSRGGKNRAIRGRRVKQDSSWN
ncbi:hypothetical protein IFM89_030481 [Coptis chinensis]|uniref:H(+)-transporting two-sector ATPase n=1 Tax=Coptis chinensis TaxID=261450 RepID=A0A835LJ47_9MAGN|nr:hypothetical protein IFM89_030481 [Coptis chinensis]